MDSATYHIMNEPIKLLQIEFGHEFLNMAQPFASPGIWRLQIIFDGLYVVNVLY